MPFGVQGGPPVRPEEESLWIFRAGKATWAALSSLIIAGLTASRLVSTSSTGTLSTPSALSTDQTLTLSTATGTTLTVASTTDATSKDAAGVVLEGGLAVEKKVWAGTRLVAVGEAFSSYGVESTIGAGFSYTTTNQNGIYSLDYRRVAGTSASGAHNARSLSGSQYGTIASGQTNSGAWTGLWAECLRNYVATADTGTLTQLEGARISIGHFSTDASTPTTTTMKGLYMPIYRSTGSIGTLYGIHIDNGSTTITPTVGYGIKIENTTGATAYAIHTGAGVVSIGDTTEATSVSAAASVNAGGQAVAKRSYLGTIGATFKGNVNAGVQDATAAVAGQVGEVLSSTVSGVALAATGTVGNVTSVSLTAGDWLISGHIVVTGGATGLTSGSTAKMSIVSTTATNGTSGSTMTQESVLALLANGLFALSIPQVRVNISATTTYYLTEEASYIAGSPVADGTIIATRIR